MQNNLKNGLKDVRSTIKICNVLMTWDIKEILYIVNNNLKIKINIVNKKGSTTDMF